MDIDCDGTDWQCPYVLVQIKADIRGNTDGQPNTSYGNLSAYHAPYIVVPDTFVSKKHLRNNSISAVICAGQMFYGILGDTNGDTPEVIGEASWLMGQTCFPNDHLGGGNGHASSDVLCTMLRNMTNGRHRF
jgi:chitosanase